MASNETLPGIAPIRACKPLLACLDDEQDAAQRFAMEEHIAACEHCSDVKARVIEQSAGIRTEAPFTLLRRNYGSRSAGRCEAPVVQSGGRPGGRSLAASLLLAVSFSWNVIQLRTRSHALLDSVVASHNRSLLASHLIDVPSSDQHTVKPWFTGQLDCSPVVKDLSADGFVLAGGRIDYLNGRRVAAIVYRRRLHVINLFTRPGTSSGEGRMSRDGYNVVHWSSGGMMYWAVSDVSAAELERLRQDYLDTRPR